jgi:hypothetical protein
VTFDENVVFGGDVTLTAVPATFKKTAFFAPGKSLIMTAVASTVTLGKTTGALAIGVPATNVPDVYSQVLAARDATDVVLTPEATTKLTFTGSAYTKAVTQDTSAASPGADHAIAIAGTATLISGTTYTVASADKKVGTLELGRGAKLTLGDQLLENPPSDYTHASPVVALTGAASSKGAFLKGVGLLDAGGTAITGGTSGWQADGAGGLVMISRDSIAGSVADLSLTAGSPESGITVGATKTLTVNSVAITLGAGKGKVTLVGGSTGGKLLLKGGGTGTTGKLVVDTAKISVATLSSLSSIELWAGASSDSTTNATITPLTGIAITTAAKAVLTNGVPFGSISGGATPDTTDAEITGKNTVIVNGSFIKTTGA